MITSNEQMQNERFGYSNRPRLGVL